MSFSVGQRGRGRGSGPGRGRGMLNKNKKLKGKPWGGRGRGRGGDQGMEDTALVNMTPENEMFSYYVSSYGKYILHIYSHFLLIVKSWVELPALSTVCITMSKCEK